MTERPLPEIRIKAGVDGLAEDLIALFARTFTASEGPEEGAVIEDLVTHLIATTPPQDLRAFRAEGPGGLVAGVLFTPLVYPSEPHRVMLLSPMAVAPEVQGQGIGQTLIREALSALGAEGVEVVITYGDPAFYGRTGFASISQETAAAPHPLSAPQGWLGQALAGGEIPRLAGRPDCAPAFNRPDVW